VHILLINPSKCEERLRIIHLPNYFGKKTFQEHRMKIFFKPAVICILGLLATPPLFAETIAAADTGSKPGVNEKLRTFAAKRLTQCVGKDVYNNDDKKIGTINNIVLDGDVNCISYMVVSYGGFAGMGNKLFAVPWAAFEHRGGAPDKVYLNIKEDILKNAPGFDKDSWPDMGDATFRKQVDAYYDLKAAGRPRSAAIKAEEDKAATAAPGPNAGPVKRGLVWTRRVTDIFGANVKNAQNESLGEIKDLVADTNTGEVRYAVLSYGGMMGMGDKLFAVPLSSLRSKPDSKEFVLDVPKEKLKSAPGFDKNSWPDWADEKYRSTIDVHYQISKSE
jgi:sporulation protein YlmC with PRC-barrel domain